MEAVLTSPNRQLVVNIEDVSLINDVRRAIKMLRGVTSVRMSSMNNGNTITPALAKRIQNARAEFQSGETITCSNKEEMQKYFDSL